MATKTYNASFYVCPDVRMFVMVRYLS